MASLWYVHNSTQGPPHAAGDNWSVAISDADPFPLGKRMGNDLVPLEPSTVDGHEEGVALEFGNAGLRRSRCILQRIDRLLFNLPARSGEGASAALADELT